MQLAMTPAPYLRHRAQNGRAKKDGIQPVEHANPNRHETRPAHPTAHVANVARIGAIVHPGPAAPRGTSAWRQANSRSPDTLLPSHGGAYSNGDRRLASGKSDFHPH